MSDCGDCDNGGGCDDNGGGYDGGGHYGSRDHHYEEDRRQSSSSSPMSDGAWGVLLLLIGGGLGGWKLSNSLQKVLNWESTSGTIIGSTSCSTSQRLLKSSNNRDTCYNSYAAIISYTVEEIQYQITSNTCKCDSQPTVGAGMKVRYDPMDPSKAVDSGFVSLWLFPMVLLFVAVLGLGLLMKGIQ